MRRRRSRRSAFGADIWPGFVDALASLLMVVIFLLMVFALAQHYLSTALSGRDIALAEATAAATAAAQAQTAAETRIAAQDKALHAAADTLDKAKVGAQEDAAQIANLEDALASAVRMTATTQSALDRALAGHAKTKASYAKAQADSAKAQAAHITTAAAAAETAAAALAAAEARIADQGAVLSRTADNLVRVEADLAKTEQERARVTATLSQTEGSLQAASARALAEAARADAAESNAARLEVDIAAGRDAAAALRQAIAQAEQQAMEQAVALAALQEVIQAKRAALTASGTANMTLEARLSTLERQISGLNSELSARKAANKKALGAAAVEAADRAGEINRLNVELDAALALAATVADDLQYVRTALAAAEVAQDAAALQAAERAAEIKAELLALRQSADADMAASARSIHAAKAEAAAYVREIAALETGLATALHRFGESEGRRKALAEEVRRLRGALAHAQQSDVGAIAAREALAATLAERDHANTRAVARYQGRIDTLEAEISRLNTRAVALQGAADAAETGLIQARTAAAGLTEERDRVVDERVRIARLNAELQAKLDQLNTALDAALADAEARGATIVQLRGKLNAALAAKVSELRRYRSEFFGRLSALIGDRKDIRVVGDRFVLQSEVLFATAKAELGPRGKTSMRAVARSLKQIIDTIPADVNWVLRVDGHTDQRPIANERFPSNWELSTARAVAVVRALAAAGIPQNRMIAAGFGEHYPFEVTANGAGAAEVNRRNRRIEFKLTTR